MTVGEVIDEAAASLGSIDRREAGDGIEYLARGRAFAVVASDTAEFRLEPIVARAALGTPDTASSIRGPDWVAFRPRELDQFARDRAAAWFVSAWRRAQG